MLGADHGEIGMVDDTFPVWRDDRLAATPLTIMSGYSARLSIAQGPDGD